jgi:hypothetical protein
VFIVVVLLLACVAWSSSASAQQFGVTAVPNNFTMTAGTTQTITVNTQTNATTPASATSIVYNLDITDNNGQHVGITTDTPKTSTRTGSSMSTVTINITVPASVAAGHYSGPLTGHYEYAPGLFTDYEFAIVQFNVTTGAPAQDFTSIPSKGAVSIAPGGSDQVTFSTAGINGFTGPITITAPTLPNATITPPNATVNAGQSATFTFTAPPGAAAGTNTANFASRATINGSTVNHGSAIAVTVTAAQPDFSLQASTSTVTLSPGASQPVTISVQPVNGFSGPVTVIASSSRSDVTVTPTTMTVNPGSPQTFTIAATPGASGGSASISFTGTAAAVTGSRVATVIANILTPTPQPDFSLSVTANPPQVFVGGTVQFTFNVTPINGFTAAVHVVPQPIADVVFSPASIDVRPGSPMTMTATVGFNAIGALARRTAATALNFVFNASSGSIVHNGAAQTMVTVLPAPSNAPTITSITPPSLLRGGPRVTLRVAGTNFVAGAVVVPNVGSAITVIQTNVLTPQLADVTLSVDPNADLRRPYSLKLRNPNLAESQPAVVFVYGQDSLAAPLGVRAAAILTPVEGSFVANNQAVYPRGLVASTGSGTLHGEWRYDGAAYERFDVQAQGGLPIEVRGKQQIPAGAWGEHTLSLAIAARLEDLAPNAVGATVSPTITVIATVDALTNLSIYEPADRAIIGRDIPSFRWTMVTGVTGYRLYLGTPQKPALHVVRIPDATGQWTPVKADLVRLGIGAGVYVWRVAPMFPGDVEGQPSEPRSIIILPDAVRLRVESSSAASIKWAGGSPGLLYVLDFFAEDGRKLFHAVTAQPSYRTPVSGREAVSFRVNAFTPGGDLVGQSLRRSLSFAVAEDQPSTAAPHISGMMPAEGTTVDTTQPQITGLWDAPVEKSAVLLFVDDNDITPVSNVTPTSIAYGSLLPLAPGLHTVKLTVGATTSTWTFTVAGAATAGTAIVAEPAAAHSDYTLAPNGNVTVVHKQSKNSGHAQFTGQGDVANAQGFETKFNGDLGYKAGTDPSTFAQESRNWVTHFAGGGTPVHAEANVGYTAPDFSDQAEYLTSGAARTGVVGKVVSKAATFSYYQPVNTALHGVMSGDPTNLKIRSAAIATPDGQPWSVRAIGLEVTDPGTANQAGSALRTFGLFGKYDLSPKLSLLGEVAQGTVKAECGSLSAEALANGVPCPTASRSGHAFKLGLSGMVANTTYGLIVREVGANFVNPANRGLTMGGVTDRLSADLNLARQVGKASVGATFRRQEGGRSHDSTGARASQDAFNLTFAMPFTQTVNFNANVTTSQDRGDASTTFFTPKTDRSNGGITATLSEILGKFSVSQAVGVQKTADRINPLSDQTGSNASVNVSGSPFQQLNLSGTAAFTRSAGAATLGTTNQLTLSFQPSLALFGFLSMQPRIAYNRSTNDLTHYMTSGDQYSAILQLSPPWANSLLSAQASANWNGNTSENPLSTRVRQFGRTYQATMNVRWGGFHGGTAPAPPNPLPGVAPEQPPAPSVQAVTK